VGGAVISRRAKVSAGINWGKPIDFSSVLSMFSPVDKYVHINLNAALLNWQGYMRSNGYFQFGNCILKE